MFQKLSRNVAKATKFFNNTLPGQVRKASTFFGNKILPHVRLANNLIQNGAKEIQKADFVDPSIKKAAGNVSSFASAGLKNLQETHNQVAKRFD